MKMNKEEAIKLIKSMPDNVTFDLCSKWHMLDGSMTQFATFNTNYVFGSVDRYSVQNRLKPLF